MTLFGHITCGNPPDPIHSGAFPAFIEAGDEESLASKDYHEALDSWFGCIRANRDVVLLPFVDDRGNIPPEAIPLYEASADYYHRQALTWLEDLNKAAADILSSDIMAVNNVVIDTGEAVISNIIGGFDVITGTWHATNDEIFSSIEEGLAGQSDTFDTIATWIADSLFEQMADRDAIFLALEESIFDAIELTEAAAQQVWADTIRLLGDTFEIAFQELKQTNDNLEFIVKAETAERTLQNALLIGELLDPIDGLIAQWDGIIRTILDEYAIPLGDKLDKIPAELIEKGRGEFDLFTGEIDAEGVKLSTDLFDLFDTGAGIDPTINSLLNHILHKYNPIGPWILARALPFLMGGLTAGLLKPETELLLQAHSKLVPYTLLGIPDLLEAVRREIIDREAFNDSAARQGYGATERNTFLQLLTQQVAPGDLINWFYRGFIDDETLRDRLGKLGYTETDSSKIIQASQLIPPVGDLISMAVREAFSDETASLFRLDEDFPEELATFAAQQGLSREWSERFWRAHWRLPSAQQGFQMLHREVISETELGVLLKALDIMPRFRDALTEIAHNRLTRVDIRRAFALGILTETEVRQQYKLGGANDENADILTQIAVEISGVNDEPEAEEVRALTRGQIEAFYKKGVIDRDRAKSLLLALDYTTAHVNLILNLTDLALEENQRNDVESDITADIKARVITNGEAEISLSSQGFTADEIRRIIAKASRGLARKESTPSEGKLQELYFNDVITLAEYEEGVSTLGFADVWVGRYATVASAEKTDRAAKEQERIEREEEKAFRPVPLSQLEVLWRAESIDDNEYLDGVRRLRFAPPYPELFLAVIKGEASSEDEVLAENAAKDMGENEKEPSLGLLQKLFKQGVIDDAVFRQGLSSLHYAAVWIDRIIELMNTENEDA